MCLLHPQLFGIGCRDYKCLSMGSAAVLTTGVFQGEGVQTNTNTK